MFSYQSMHECIFSSVCQSVGLFKICFSHYKSFKQTYIQFGKTFKNQYTILSGKKLEECIPCKKVKWKINIFQFLFYFIICFNFLFKWTLFFFAIDIQMFNWIENNILKLCNIFQVKTLIFFYVKASMMLKNHYFVKNKLNIFTFYFFKIPNMYEWFIF